MRTPIVLLLALLWPAGFGLVQAPHTPRLHTTTAALDPAGTFDLDLDLHRQVAASVLTLTGESDGRLKGTLAVHAQSIALDSVSARNHVVKLASGSELILARTVKDHNAHNALAGRWVRAHHSGTLSGARRIR